VIFEAKALPGGLNTTGIAPYKLQADDSIDEVEWVRSLGVEIQTGIAVGAGITGKQLLAEYEAVFVGVGLGADTKLGIPGEDGPGVFGATTWIEKLKLAKDAGEELGRVAVIGGGNTALDCARECAQLGAFEVTLFYRRPLEDMSGYAHELEAARLEGVTFMSQMVPVAFVRDDRGELTGIRVARAQDGKPVPGPHDELPLPYDLVLVAIGQSKLHALASEFPGVALDGRGCIVADPKTGATGNPKVFSGGDCLNGGKEVVNAVADGRNAARVLLRRWGEA
jgi:glutamate synthase (NADPH/NADH) small chain